ncbi:hypothetical protein MC7420_1147 [Coleofasciculus chthonoplastes PCC 7420]|uniref:Lipoprotein n=1 Tax=Coleofasciculus chthonoplastes PCC 7420 TaxID=118168 RepID=B4VXD8_9CYAN|nr:hypothetical protein MC7420_1147 [Coleofasciculus chthonoplastes PCC 7420]
MKQGEQREQGKRGEILAVQLFLLSCTRDRIFLNFTTKTSCIAPSPSSQERRDRIIPPIPDNLACGGAVLTFSQAWC